MCSRLPSGIGVWTVVARSHGVAEVYTAVALFFFLRCRLSNPSRSGILSNCGLTSVSWGWIGEGGFSFLKDLVLADVYQGYEEKPLPDFILWPGPPRPGSSRARGDGVVFNARDSCPNGKYRASVGRRGHSARHPAAFNPAAAIESTPLDATSSSNLAATAEHTARGSALDRRFQRQLERPGELGSARAAANRRCSDFRPRFQQNHHE
jgi:hypothetical protein